MLGLNVGATRREIARAYRSGVRRYHPDTMSAEAFSPASRKSADRALARVMEAYEALLRPSTGAENERPGKTTSPPPQQSPSDHPPGDRLQSHHMPVRYHAPRLLAQDTPPIQVSPLWWKPAS
ncbi:J domain-containing protein [Paeniglutamicibacter antarcticus]|uniref:J domain-containing protein n=1 Tax=Paeniglutamicibacter antarcticus TaxID=494023 RepID=UPI003CD053A4